MSIFEIIVELFVAALLTAITVITIWVAFQG